MTDPNHHSRIHLVDPDRTTGKVKRLLEQIQAKLGLVPNIEIVATVANVALNIFTNYMSHVARVPIDFPQSDSRETSRQGGE